MQRVLIANRGEVAVRVIRAVHELGLEAVAVYSTADAGALHTRLADRSVRIGPPPAAASYLNIPSLVAAAVTTGCEAVHPGWGFLAENADFARACEDNDLVFVGPDADVMARMGDKAEAKREVARACRHIGYLNAGTFEFLLEADGGWYFIELNARLQVEHPVSELVTGIDVVREQLRIAAGERLTVTGRAPRRGHAIEARINAEDPTRGFAPAPGVIERFRPPLGPGVRVDTHVEEGAVIPPFYDSLIAKVIVWDESRPAAIERSLRALAELDVRGVATTRDVAAEIIGSEGFRSGVYSTSFLQEAELQAVGAA